jgi:hypothetical protein
MLRLSGKQISCKGKKNGAVYKARIEALRQQKAEAEQRRIQELVDLAGREESTWRWIESLIGQKQAGPYDKATKLLVDLHDLAMYQESLSHFQEKFEELKGKVANRPAILARFERAGL